MVKIPPSVSLTHLTDVSHIGKILDAKSYLTWDPRIDARTCSLGTAVLRLQKRFPVHSARMDCGTTNRQLCPAASRACQSECLVLDNTCSFAKSSSHDLDIQRTARRYSTINCTTTLLTQQTTIRVPCFLLPQHLRNEPYQHNDVTDNFQPPCGVA